MSKKILPLFIILFFTLISSCQEDPEPIDPGTDPSLSDVETRSVQINLPTGANLDLSGAKLLSFGIPFPVAADGKTQAVNTPDGGNLAYLFSKDDQLLLMGFLSQNQNELTPKTTAEVLLYMGSTLWLNPQDNTQEFFEKITQVEAAASYIESFEEAWKADPYLLDNGNFINSLEESLKTLFPPGKEVDIRSRLSDINVDEGNVQSGIQVFESDLGRISVNNYYRRRAHAFAYKMSTKLENGTVNTLISNFGPGLVATKDFGVPATPAVTNLTGALGQIIESGGEALGKSTVDNPLDMNLAENEVESTYKIRVVGAGSANPAIQMTDAERLTQIRLGTETLVLDFIYPAVQLLVGWKDDIPVGGIVSQEAADFLEKYTPVINAIPGAYDKMMEGDMPGALESVLFYIYEASLTGAMEDLLKSPYEFLAKRYVDKGKIPSSISEIDASQLQRFAKILKVIDAVIGSTDLILVSTQINLSQSINEWNLTARASKVSLSPGESSVSSYGSKEITAEIKNLQEEGGDNFPYFKWTTTGKYGIIQDRRGNRGTTFESSDNKVTYYSQTGAGQLPEENNLDYIYVEAFYKNQSIGKDTVVINNKKSTYVLKPKGMILSGKEGNVNRVSLYIEPVRERDSDFTGMKIVWSVEGKHGKLKDQSFSTVITTYDTNRVWYECLDAETAKGVEKVTARIYQRSAVDGEYFLFEELNVDIQINNEERIKIVEAKIQTDSWGPNREDIWVSCGADTRFLIEADPDAISYTATVVDFGSETIPALTGYTRTWSAEVAPTVGNSYEFARWFSSSSSYPYYIPIDCPAHTAQANARWGTAVVVIRLKN